MNCVRCEKKSISGFYCEDCRKHLQDSLTQSGRLRRIIGGRKSIRCSRCRSFRPRNSHKPCKRCAPKQYTCVDCGKGTNLPIIESPWDTLCVKCFKVRKGLDKPKKPANINAEMKFISYIPNFDKGTVEIKDCFVKKPAKCQFCGQFKISFHGCPVRKPAKKEVAFNGAQLRWNKTKTGWEINKDLTLESRKELREVAKEIDKMLNGEWKASYDFNKQKVTLENKEISRKLLEAFVKKYG